MGSFHEKTVPPCWRKWHRKRGSRSHNKALRRAIIAIAAGSCAICHRTYRAAPAERPGMPLQSRVRFAVSAMGSALAFAGVFETRLQPVIAFAIRRRLLAKTVSNDHPRRCDRSPWRSYGSLKASLRQGPSLMPLPAVSEEKEFCLLRHQPFTKDLPP